MNMSKLMKLLPMLTMVASLAYATYAMQPVGSSTSTSTRPDTAPLRKSKPPARKARHLTAGIPRQASSARSARPRSEIRLRL